MTNAFKFISFVPLSGWDWHKGPIQSVGNNKNCNNSYFVVTFVFGSGYSLIFIIALGVNIIILISKEIKLRD